MKKIEIYSRYMKHDPHINKNFPKYMRLANHRISKLLENIDFTKWHDIDYHVSKAKPLNNSGFLVDILKEYDDSCIYLNEAEAKTISTKEFIEDFVDFCKKNLPYELVNVTFNQLYRDNDANGIVSSPPVIADEDQDISSLICLALPTYSKNTNFTNRLIREFVEIAVNDGYFLAYPPSNIICKHHDGLIDKVNISYLTFEAKYTNLNVDLSSNLFHVTLEDSLKNIAKNGLKPKSESTEFSYPPRIFLFNKTEYDEILAYGLEKAKSKGKKSFYIVRIDKSAIENYPLFKSKKFMLYRDPCFSHSNEKTDETAIFTYDEIPLSLLNSNIVKYDISTMEPIVMTLKDFT